MRHLAKLVSSLAGLALLAATAPAIVAQQSRNAPIDSLLARYLGHWRMEGEVRGQRVLYDMQGSAVLGDRYVEQRLAPLRPLHSAPRRDQGNLRT